MVRTAGRCDNFHYRCSHRAPCILLQFNGSIIVVCRQMTLCSRFTEQKLSSRLGQQIVPKLAAESRVGDAVRLASIHVLYIKIRSALYSVYRTTRLWDELIGIFPYKPIFNNGHMKGERVHYYFCQQKFARFLHNVDQTTVIKSPNNFNKP